MIDIFVARDHDRREGAARRDRKAAC